MAGIIHTQREGIGMTALWIALAAFAGLVMGYGLGTTHGWEQGRRIGRSEGKHSALHGRGVCGEEGQ